MRYLQLSISLYFTYFTSLTSLPHARWYTYLIADFLSRQIVEVSNIKVRTFAQFDKLISIPITKNPLDAHCR